MFFYTVSTTGVVLAGSTDATFEPLGYALVVLQNICSACSLTFAKESQLPSRQIVLLNSIAGSVVCGALAVALERDLVVAFPFDASFVLVTALMCSVCVLYQFAIMICTIRNSALATSVTGNVKDLASTTCGFLFFPDVQIRAANIAGVTLSLIGAYSFSYLKYLALTQTVTAVPPRKALVESNGTAPSPGMVTRRRKALMKEE
jgi:solute carrier family 35